MDVADKSTGAFAALTDRELAVLRLLASGHTAKTIAVQLGCSETAINERLRDARRKTGIGSSRELARLLDAQKIWDRNFEVPAARQPPDDPGRRSIDERPGSKGLIMMLVATPVVVGLAALATPTTNTAPTAPVAHAAQSKASPLVGRWSLDVARLPEDERPQRVMISFRADRGDKWTMMVDVVARDGTTTHAESTATVDGAPVPITGNMGAIDTAALRQPAPNTLVVTLGRGGVPVSTRVYTVAKDRKSMTETIVWAGKELPGLETTHFYRVE